VLRKYSMNVNSFNEKYKGRKKKEREKQCVDGRLTYISNTL